MEPPVSSTQKSNNMPFFFVKLRTALLEITFTNRVNFDENDVSYFNKVIPLTLLLLALLSSQRTSFFAFPYKDDSAIVLRVSKLM